MDEEDNIAKWAMPDKGLSVSNPNSYFKDTSCATTALLYLEKNDLRSAIVEGFNLPENDSYVYHAIASVTLSQVQAAIEAGTTNGLCDWYVNEQGISLGHPPESDIAAYTAIFLSTTASPTNALKSLSANAKKTSLRSSVASNLLAKRCLSPTFPPIPKPSKANRKLPLFNPYLDFWMWSCHALHWAGPSETTANVRTSHALLPIFMHHFGCVVPSREALDIIRLVAFDDVKRNAQPRVILDIGSGNGYWTYMLRATGLAVVAVDNQQSVFRCNWIGDTNIMDGVPFLRSRKGASEDVLLLVYPVVGGDFFRKMLDAYKGIRVVVAGTQCRNGYTGFADKTVDIWMQEQKPEWVMEVRVALPSFAGKDEALYVFKKGPPTSGSANAKGKK